MLPMDSNCSSPPPRARNGPPTAVAAPTHARTGSRIGRRELLTWLLASGLGIATAGADPASVIVEDWSAQSIGTRGIPEGWKAQTWGSPKYDFEIVAGPNGKVLHLKSEGDSSTISKEVKVDLKEYPILEWRWKVITVPVAADLRRKETDDQAAQLYVVFPRFPTAVRSRIIGYVWDTTAPAGTITASKKTGTVTYVVVRSGQADVDKWMTERRNVWDDYRQIYKQDPDDPVGGVSIGIDSDDVRDRAESYFGPVTFLKR
jgi:hypothetical protein